MTLSAAADRRGGLSPRRPIGNKNIPPNVLGPWRRTGLGCRLSPLCTPRPAQRTQGPGLTLRSDLEKR